MLEKSAFFGVQTGGWASNRIFTVYRVNVLPEMLGELSETQALAKIIILSVYLIFETSLTAVIVSNMFMCLFLSREEVDKITLFFFWKRKRGIIFYR